MDILFNHIPYRMKALTFNEWQDHLTKQLNKDKKKLNLIPKRQKHENKLQKISSREPTDLCRV